MITQWDEIGKLGFVFPSLIELRMSECPLENITATEIPKQFPNLKVLNLNDTLLDSWEAIDALKRFPGLTDVSLMGIPLLDQYSDQEKRQLLIARLANIQKLNDFSFDITWMMNFLLQGILNWWILMAY